MRIVRIRIPRGHGGSRTDGQQDATDARVRACCVNHRSETLQSGEKALTVQPPAFFSSVISAGAILTGFCGSFLAFRIQREASYYRQPALNYDNEDARDIYIGLSHFSLPFLLLIIASVGALFFGVLLPLFGIAGVSNALVAPGVTVAGLGASAVVLCGYFWSELSHYEILRGKLINDAAERRRARPIVFAMALLVLVVVGIVWRTGLLP